MTKQNTKTSSAASVTVLHNTDTSRDLQALFMAQIGTEPFNEARPVRPTPPEGYTATMDKLGNLVEGTARGMAGSAYSSSMTGDDVTGLFLEQVDKLSRSGFEFSDIGPAMDYRSKQRQFSSAERQYDDRAERALTTALEALKDCMGDVLGVLEARDIIGADIAEAGAAPNRTLATVAVENLLAEKNQQQPKPLALRAGRGLMLLSAAGIDAASLEREDVVRAGAGAMAEHSRSGAGNGRIMYAGGSLGVSLKVSDGVVYDMRETAAAGQGLKRYAVLAATSEAKLEAALATLQEEHEQRPVKWRTAGMSRTLPDPRSAGATDLIARHSHFAPRS